MLNVTIVGFGNVGTSLALLLLNNKYSLRLNIIDPEPQREGAILDLAHGMPLYPQKALHVNDEALFLNADFIFYSAGTPNVHGGSRLATAKQNIQLTKEIFEHRIFTRIPYIIVITNPVDIVSHSVYQFSGLAPDRVVGTGAFLDSIRLAYYLALGSDFKPADFEAFVLGEHGASQVPVYSLTKVKGQPILEHSAFDAKSLQLAQQQTKDAAYEIRKTQQGTTYGVSKCAEVLMDYLLGEDAHFLPLSMLTNAHYRKLLNLDHDIYISLPVSIQDGKLTLDNEIQFSADELEALRESAAILADIIE